MDSNAEIVRRGFAAIARNDLDAVLADAHENVEWRPLLSHAPGEDTFIGHAGMNEWWGRVREIFPDLAVGVEDIVENGERVYVAGSIGTESAPGLQSVGWVLWLRDGKIARMEVFQDRHEARGVAGLDQ